MDPCFDMWSYIFQSTYQLIQVVFDLFWVQYSELSIVSDNANLNVVLIHCALEPLFQCQKRCLNSVFYPYLGVVPFLEENFGGLSILTYRSCLPIVRCPWWVNLRQMWPILIVSGDENWNSEWPVTSCLSFFLYKIGCLSGKSSNSNRLVVLHVIILNNLSSLLTKESKVGAKSSINSANMLAKELGLLVRWLIHQRRWDLLFSRKYNTVLGLNAEARLSLGHSS